MDIVNAISFLLPATVQCVLVFILFSRRLYRRGMFPFFFAYTVLSVAVTFPRFALVSRPSVYTVLYWGTEILYGILAICSLNEVFGRIFWLDYEEHAWLRFVFPATVLGISIGLLMWWRFYYRTPRGGHLSLAAAAFVGFTEGVHSIEGMLLVLFVVLWIFLTPAWNRYDYGILLGFGLSGLITMTADILRFNSEPGYQLWYKYAPSTAYAVVTLVWFYAFWPKHDPKPKPETHFRTMLENTKRSSEIIQLIYEWLKRRR